VLPQAASQLLSSLAGRGTRKLIDFSIDFARKLRDGFLLLRVRQRQ
jgi:hypothetical protein